MYKVDIVFKVLTFCVTIIVFVRTHLGVALDMVQLVKHQYQGVRGQTVAELNAPLLPLPRPATGGDVFCGL